MDSSAAVLNAACARSPQLQQEHIWSGKRRRAASEGAHRDATDRANMKTQMHAQSHTRTRADILTCA